MSAFYDIAEAISARLKTHALLANVTVVVDRQRDIASELTKAIGKQTGHGLLVVTWTGGTNKNEVSAQTILETTFTVVGFFKPVMRRGDTPADDIIESAVKHLHDWKLNDSGFFHNRIVVKSIEPFQHPELLAMRINLSLITEL